MARTLVASPDYVQRMIGRLAHEIVERNRGAAGLELVGIRSQGTVLAGLLGNQLEQITGRSFEVHDLDVTPYRDDIDEEVEDTSSVEASLQDRDVILVDDVLFTGRTVRAAIDGVLAYGRPRSIQLVILIDRGHREYPLQPDYLGRALPTKHGERVVVEMEDGPAVYIEE